jgi:hypothetical protein
MLQFKLELEIPCLECQTQIFWLLRIVTLEKDPAKIVKFQHTTQKLMEDSQSSAASDAEAAQDDGGWSDWEEEGEEDAEPAKSLFCDEMLKSPEQAIQYDAENFGFDIRAFATQASHASDQRLPSHGLNMRANIFLQEQLDEYDIFRCINFIRGLVKEGRSPLSAKGILSSLSWKGNDDFLKPVLDNDSLLFFNYDNVVSAWR